MPKISSRSSKTSKTLFDTPSDATEESVKGASDDGTLKTATADVEPSPIACSNTSDSSAPVTDTHPSSPPITSAAIPSEEKATPSPRAEFIEELKGILVPQGKRGVPTLVGFGSRISNAKRYVIIDVNDGVFMDGWRLYRERMDDDPEGYLACVYDALSMPVPKLYRYVVPVEL